jgi:hypothetical protein
VPKVTDLKPPRHVAYVFQPIAERHFSATIDFIVLTRIQTSRRCRTIILLFSRFFVELSLSLSRFVDFIFILYISAELEPGRGLLAALSPF